MMDSKARRLFWLGVVLKWAAIPFFASTYMRDLFIPFMDKAVLNVGTNPWSLLPPEYFPYGSVLFTLLFIPRYLAYLLLGPAALGQGLVGLCTMKLPLFAMDVFLLFQLLSVNPKKSRLIVLYYWLNPVLFYINYVHGQLDVAAMSFCIASLLFLIRGSHIRSAIFMAMATLCKFHVVIAIPLLLAYLWNTEFPSTSIKKILTWVGIWAALSFAGFLPLLLAKQITYVTTSSPQALRLLGIQLLLGQDKVLFLGVMILLLAMGRLCISTKMTPHGLLMGTGMLFGLLILVTDSMQGWYYWVFPFLALFYASYVTVHTVLFWALAVVYLGYFGVIVDAGVASGFLGGKIVFSLLQTLLVGVLVEIWIFSIRNEMPLLGRTKPLLIGIAGDSGTGKNTFTSALIDLFGPGHSLMLDGDDYHRWERGKEDWATYTHLNPKANKLPTLSTHTKELLKGRFVYHPRYDHTTGTFSDSREIKPAKTILVQGLLTFYLREMRDNFDLKVFLAPDERVRKAWKIKRDVHERGHSVENVLASIDRRKGDSAEHVDPQKNFADWIIEVYPFQKINEAEIKKGDDSGLGVRHILWNDAPVELLCESLEKIAHCTVKVETLKEDINRTVIEIKGTPTEAQIKKIAHQLFPDIRQLTRAWVHPQWQDGLMGINQLIALMLLQSKVS